MTNAHNPRRRLGEVLYALSFAGAYLGFMPLLMLLLPRRIVVVAPGHAFSTLSGLLVLGGVVAGLANIAAGAIGDAWFARHGSRRAVIAVGLGGLVASYALLAISTTVPALAASLVCFQVMLNLMLAPLGAVMTDYVPDARKGHVAGWLNAGLPASILMVTAIALIAPADGVGGYVVVAALVAGLVVPLLAVWPFDTVNLAPNDQTLHAIGGRRVIDRRDLVLAALARLLMQLGGALMVNYLFLYLVSLRTSARVESIPEPSAAVGTLALVAGGASICGALVAGHGSDSKRRRKSPMIVAALAVALALLLTANPLSWPIMVVSYGAFQAALTAYLAIDTALVAQLLGKHPRRGTVQGLMNLTNTLPAICVPMLALLSNTQTPDLVTLSRLIIASALAPVIAASLVGWIRSIP